ncbi:hypothetical protein [Endozoicomonas elysicola]|uniref:Uncharacterized protein n=1 Tax=Endozoicomonas elysicola TaxID=305900 RepID=A0A081K6R7_9GAMM|nr:hypothetical protein [Endozoicomonas elysicola]KEI69843.1 hypothetical protein GV64_02975 [Endozoicomonas elysicola]
MMESAFENPRHRLTGEPSSTASLFTGRQETSQRSTSQFAFHDTTAIPSSQNIPLLSHQKYQTDNVSISGEMTTRFSNLSRITNHDQKKQNTEEESQSSTITTGELDPDLERIISKPLHHSTVNKENKQQMRSLKAVLKTLIKIFVENDEYTVNLLHSLINSIKIGLIVVASRLNSPDIPDENKNHFYSLARLQLQFTLQPPYPFLV